MLLPQDSVCTMPIADPGSLLCRLPPIRDVTCWLRHGDGIVGIGSAYSCTFASPGEAEAWWQEISSNVKVDNHLSDESMAGPIAFISFPFASMGAYEVVVPQIIIGRRGGKSWLTTWNGVTCDLIDVLAPPRGCEIAFHSGNLNRREWIQAVHLAVSRIRDSDLAKVVLARDEVGRSTMPLDLRYVLAHLAVNYPQTWTFCVKSLVGASPELLIRQERGLIISRVLAGTIHGDHDDSALADALRSSSKDLVEHEYAVASVADALRSHVTSLHVPEVPFVLQLPNVMHLASDITGAVRPGSTALGLAAAIHPSAAVCGTPTNQAQALIEEVEGMDRGRYAGPVGWVNVHGDGEIALALRCGMVEDHQVRIFAGCGIVADSDPEAEWEETTAKLLPMKQALTGGADP